MKPPKLPKKVLAWLEKVYAYLHLVLTRRYVLVDVITEEAHGDWVSVSMRVRTRTPHHLSEAHLMRPVPITYSDLIPSVAANIGIERVRAAELPPTTVLIRHQSKTIAIVG